MRQVKSMYKLRKKPQIILHRLQPALLVIVGLILFAYTLNTQAATRLQKAQVAIVHLSPVYGVPCPADPARMFDNTWKTNCLNDKRQFGDLLTYLNSAVKDNKITSSEWSKIKNKTINLKPITPEMMAFKGTIHSALSGLMV